jgi:hypothetical protein
MKKANFDVIPAKEIIFDSEEPPEKIKKHYIMEKKEIIIPFSDQIKKACQENNIYISKYMNTENYIKQLLKINWKSDQCKINHNQNNSELYLCKFYHSDKERENWERYYQEYNNINDEYSMNDILDSFDSFPESLKNKFFL